MQLSAVQAGGLGCPVGSCRTAPGGMPGTSVFLASTWRWGCRTHPVLTPDPLTTQRGTACLNPASLQ